MNLPTTFSWPLSWVEPVEIADRLRPLGQLVFLDSAMSDGDRGRYSYLGVDPFATLRVTRGVAYWNDQPSPLPPTVLLAQKLEQYRQPALPGLPPLQGGAMGYFSYEFGRLLERLPETLPSEQGSIDDVELMFYDVICAFDHQHKKAWIISTGLSRHAPQACAQRALERAQWLLGAILEPVNGSAINLGTDPIARQSWHSNFTPQSYATAVRQVIDSILDGDIFQANIAQRFTATLPKSFDSWAFYRRLRQVNAAPFCAFIDRGDTVIASSSPERFIKVEGTQVETRPIKGTARRALDAEQDLVIVKALLASEKDRAENMMIVDLLRNDLSRLCKPGTVVALQLCQLETYAGVHHLVSSVCGELETGHTAAELMNVTFPGGSITGAPKIKAMEVISNIEKTERGIYCGVIGYFSFSGHCDTNIAIRTVLFKSGSVSFQAGGGITALSDPDAEYQETLSKAERIFMAFAADGVSP